MPARRIFHQLLDEQPQPRTAAYPCPWPRHDRSPWRGRPRSVEPFTRKVSREAAIKKLGQLERKVARMTAMMDGRDRRLPAKRINATTCNPRHTFGPCFFSIVCSTWPNNPTSIICCLGGQGPSDATMLLLGHPGLSPISNARGHATSSSSAKRDGAGRRHD